MRYVTQPRWTHDQRVTVKLYKERIKALPRRRALTQSRVSTPEMQAMVLALYNNTMCQGTWLTATHVTHRMSAREWRAYRAKLACREWRLT
jgi:hypothetical protein